MIRLTSVSYSLWKEKIEDGVFLRVYLFGRREPVLLREDPHWKELGEIIARTLPPHPPLPSVFCVRESSLSFSTACCVLPAVVPLAPSTYPITTQGVIP